MEENQGHLNIIQDLNRQGRMVCLRRNTSQGRNQEGQAADHQGGIYQRKGKADCRKVVEEVADRQRDQQGRLRGHGGTVNLQGGEADLQGTVVVPQEGGVNLQDDVAGLGHHADQDEIVINTRVATQKDRHIKGTQIMSKFSI